MSKELKSYLHFYIGCGVRVRIDHNDVWSEWITLQLHDLYTIIGKSMLVELRLRSLSNLTKEECILIGIGMWSKLNSAKATARGYKDIQWFPEEFVELLKREFDLFGLIEAGLAIEKQTIKAQL